MGRLPIAITAAVLLWAAAAQAAFVNGVERFDSSSPDTDTWTASTSATVDHGLLGFGAYSVHSFTVGVGQGVRATVSTNNTFYGQGNFLYLADRSAGFLTRPTSDQNYIGLGISWHPEIFFHNFPPVGPLSVAGGWRLNNSGGGANLLQRQNESILPTLDLEIDRLDLNVFKFSAWYTGSNVPFGAYIADVSRALGGGVSQDMPPNLYIVLNSDGTGAWQNVTIVAAPEAGMAGLILGLGLTIAGRPRMRPEGQHRLVI